MEILFDGAGHSRRSQATIDDSGDWQARTMIGAIASDRERHNNFTIIRAEQEKEEHIPNRRKKFR